MLAMAYTVEFFAATELPQPYPQDNTEMLGLMNKTKMGNEVYYDTDDDVFSDDGVDMTSTTSKSMGLSTFSDPSSNWRPLPDPSLDDYGSEDKLDSDDEMMSTLSTRSTSQLSSTDWRPNPVHNMNELNGSLFLSTSQLSSQRAKDNEVESERFEFDDEQHEAPIGASISLTIHSEVCEDMQFGQDFGL